MPHRSESLNTGPSLVAAERRWLKDEQESLLSGVSFAGNWNVSGDFVFGSTVQVINKVGICSFWVGQKRHPQGIVSLLASRICIIRRYAPEQPKAGLPSPSTAGPTIDINPRTSVR